MSIATTPPTSATRRAVHELRRVLPVLPRRAQQPHLPAPALRRLDAGACCAWRCCSPRASRSILLYGLLCGYGFAWLGHFGFEKNKPASLQAAAVQLHGRLGDVQGHLDGKNSLLSVVCGGPACSAAATIVFIMASALDDRVPHIERLVDAIDLPIGRWDRERPAAVLQRRPTSPGPAGRANS